MLSDDDRDLQGLSDDELALAWDLWFDLAQATNDADPPYTHGVFQRVALEAIQPPASSDSGFASSSRPPSRSRRA